MSCDFCPICKREPLHRIGVATKRLHATTLRRLKQKLGLFSDMAGWVSIAITFKPPSTPPFQKDDTVRRLLTNGERHPFHRVRQ